MTDNKIKIQIKSVFGKVLFEYEKEGNTVNDTVEEAVKISANLRGADLRCADLSNANLRYADLRGANLRYADLRGADLSNADLSNANLSNADLSNADLSNANLSNADLRYANLRGANLRCADLRGADLRCADLRGADLRGADLRGADLSNADLRGADLRGADLRGADLRGADNIPLIPFSCPSDGAFIGWKKVKGKLIKLLIPEDAKRQSSTGWKCRCDKAKVLAITDLNGSNPIDEITSMDYAKCTYKVGEIVYPDSFDDNRWEECSHGIHFFANKQQAIDY